MLTIPKLATRLLLIILVLNVCLPFDTVGGSRDANEKIYSSSLMAIKNIFATKDAFQERRDKLEKEEERIKKEKEKLYNAESQFGIIVPNGRMVEDSTRTFLRSLGDINDVEERYQSHSEEDHRKSSNLVRNIVVGGLVGVACLALGIFLGKSIGGKSKHDHEVINEGPQIAAFYTSLAKEGLKREI